MSRKPQDEQTFRVRRSVWVIAILTAWSLYSIDGDAFPPHRHPLVYGLAMTWLVTIALAVVAGGFISRVDPKLFSLADWEREGEIYDRAGIRAFRWVLFHSPLAWINTTLDVRAGRADCDRLLRELNNSEGVHRTGCRLGHAGDRVPSR
jgi:hypothetical protein